MHLSRTMRGKTSPLTSSSDQSQYGRPRLPSRPRARSARRSIASKSSRYGRCQCGKFSRRCEQYSGASAFESGGMPPCISASRKKGDVPGPSTFSRIFISAAA